MPTTGPANIAPASSGCRELQPAFIQKRDPPAPKFAASAYPFRATTPTAITPSSASTLALVNTFCTAAPSRTPSVFSTVSSVITTIAARFAVFSPMFPAPTCQIQFPALTRGKNTPRNFPNATPTAAIVPVWITRNSVHPYKNPQIGPSASRRYTYCPPALGIIAASSP